MNQPQTEGENIQLRGAAKRQWGKLTDDDLKLFEGDVEILAGKIVSIYGTTLEQVKHELEKLRQDLNTLNPKDATPTPTVIPEHREAKSV